MRMSRRNVDPVVVIKASLFDSTPELSWLFDMVEYNGYACFYFKSLDVIKAIIYSVGDDVSNRDDLLMKITGSLKYGYKGTSLFWACFPCHSHEKVIELLIGSISTKNKQAYLDSSMRHVQAYPGMLECWKLLKMKPSDVVRCLSSQSAAGWTKIHTACAYLVQDQLTEFILTVLKFVEEMWDDIEDRDKIMKKIFMTPGVVGGETPIHEMVIYRSYNAIQQILSRLSPLSRRQLLNYKDKLGVDCQWLSCATHKEIQDVRSTWWPSACSKRASLYNVHYYLDESLASLVAFSNNHYPTTTGLFLKYTISSNQRELAQLRMFHLGGQGRTTQPVIKKDVLDIRDYLSVAPHLGTFILVLMNATVEGYNFIEVDQVVDNLKGLHSFDFRHPKVVCVHIFFKNCRYSNEVYQRVSRKLNDVMLPLPDDCCYIHVLTCLDMRDHIEQKLLTSESVTLQKSLSDLRSELAIIAILVSPVYCSLGRQFQLNCVSNTVSSIKQLPSSDSPDSALIICMTEGRSGYEIELNDTKHVLRNQLGFQIRCCIDPEKDKLLDEITNFCEESRSSRVLLLVTMSHGGGSDQIDLKYHKRMNVMQMIHCLHKHSQERQSKLVFLQCCRGRENSNSAYSWSEEYNIVKGFNEITSRVKGGVKKSDPSLPRVNLMRSSSICDYDVPQGFYIVYSTLSKRMSERGLLLKCLRSEIDDVWRSGQRVVDIQDLMVYVSGRVRNASYLNQNLEHCWSLKQTIYFNIYPHGDRLISSRDNQRDENQQPHLTSQQR